HGPQPRRCRRQPAGRGRRPEAVRPGRILPARGRTAGPCARPPHRRDRGCAAAAGRVRGGSAAMTDTLTPDDRARAGRPLPKPGILDIAQYVPGKSAAEGVVDPVKLSGNENILGSSSKARDAYAAAADQLHLYPDGRATPLRAAVAERFGLPPQNLVFGCGSDELIHLISQVFLEPGDNIVQAEYAFGAYAIAARACQAEVRSAPEPNFRIDVDKLIELVDERTRMVFVTNPANPTGTFVSGEELRRLQAALPPSVVLLIDAAYCEFADDPAFDN